MFSQNFPKGLFLKSCEKSLPIALWKVIDCHNLATKVFFKEDKIIIWRFIRDMHKVNDKGNQTKMYEKNEMTL
jgi:hypothetical protein